MVWDIYEFENNGNHVYRNQTVAQLSLLDKNGENEEKASSARRPYQENHILC